MKFPICPECGFEMNDKYEDVGMGKICDFGNVYNVDKMFSKKVHTWYCEPCHAIIVTDIEDEKNESKN